MELPCKAEIIDLERQMDYHIGRWRRPMDARMEHLTTTEAAIAAGVSIPQINRMIDEKILPEDLYDTTPIRTFRSDACLLIAFYFETANWLTANARLETIRNARIRCSTWNEWKDCTVGDHNLTIRFSDLWKEVDGRLRRLSEARQMVVEDPEILSGTPVIRGTRVPVHDVAAQVGCGSSDGANSQILSEPQRFAGRARLDLRQGRSAAWPATAAFHSRRDQNFSHEDAASQLLAQECEEC